MSDLSSIAEKVHRSERLSFEDGVALFRSSDLMTLARAANEVRERLNGNLAYYNVNRHINYTNVCAIDCQLCQGAYARKPGEAGGYAMRLEEVFKFAKGEYTDSLTEFHIVGGLNPDLPFEYYTDLIKGLRERFPAALPQGGLDRVVLDRFRLIGGDTLDLAFGPKVEIGCVVAFMELLALIATELVDYAAALDRGTLGNLFRPAH